MSAAKDVLSNSQPVDLTPEDFIFFKELIFQLAGISLTEKKSDLVKARLRSHIQNLGLSSFTEYRKYLKGLATNSPEFQKFINLLTTNKTDFFREAQHFDYLSQVLIPNWMKMGKKDVRIWCCATSTGEEPTTLSLVLKEHLPKEVSYRIVATDIDTEVLAMAQNGVYPVSKMTEIPSAYRNQYLQVGQGQAAGWFRTTDEIHNRIAFRQHNLIEPARLETEKFDAIFCRNVLIYFSPDTIRTLMVKLHEHLNTDGLLFIGHSESIYGCGNIFKTLKPSIFKKI